MSTVKATHFEHPSASSPGITLGSDGSVVLPSGFTGGIGTNVVSTTKDDTYSVSLASNALDSSVVTGLTATITPTSATSKILLLAFVTGAYASGSDAGHISFQLDRDGSAIGIGAAAGSRISVTSSAFSLLANNVTMGQTAVYLDSPATTSPVTYGVRLWNPVTATRTLYVNRTSADTDSAAFHRTVSVITAIEVAA